MVLVWHLSWDRVVSEVGEKGRLVVKRETSCGESERAEAA